MVLQAYIDESESDGVLVLAGHIASAEQWVRFAAEWQPLVHRYGRLDRDNARSFHMSEMVAFSPEDIPPFFRAIENHVAISLSCTINVDDLERARYRLRMMNIEWGLYANPWWFCFRCLMDMFNMRRAELAAYIAPNEPVSFTFDERGEAAEVQSSWREYMDSRPPSFRALYGDVPRFLDDRKCLPLQAADFYAWWVRRWTIDGVRNQMMDGYSYPGFEAKRRPFPKIAIVYDQEAMVDTFKELIGTANPGTVIYDLDY